MPDEKQRLAALYAAKEDEELLALAQDMAELTDEARAALETEMERRNLPRPSPLAAIPRTPPAHLPPMEMIDAPADPDSDGPVAIARFRDLPPAFVARTSLESAGIESVLYNENVVRLDWFWSNLIGGVTLHVAPEDADDTRAILAAEPEDFQPDTDGEFKQPVCPACGSRDVTFEDLNKPVTFGVLGITGLPVQVHRERWICGACDASWQETEAPSAD